MVVVLVVLGALGDSRIVLYRWHLASRRDACAL